MSMDTTDGRVAVITGASSGIGAATARALASDGHRVALLARRADRIQALCADYRQMIEVNLLGAITTTEVFLDQLPDAPRGRATASTPRPNGGSTAGRSRCVRSCSPTSPSSSPVPWVPS